MAAGYPGRDLRGSYGHGVGSAVQFPYQQRSDGGGGGGGGGGGLLKRSLTELERQQQIQHALYLRSVKQRTMHLNSPMSPLSPIDLSSYSPSSSLSSSSSGINFNFLRKPPPPPPQQQQQQQSLKPQDFNFAPPSAEFEKKSTIKNQLQELERQLLLDDDEDEDAVSVTGLGATNSDWGEAMQQLISPSPSPPPAPPQNALSPSSATSSSSSTSSSASCSPTPSAPSKQLLLDAATAISEGNLDTATANLAVLKRAANFRGDPDQRLAAMMVLALASRVNPSPGAVTSPIAELCSLEHQTATQMLYNESPCFKLGLMAANFAILDATRDHSRIHIVDFDLGQGGQYAFLINSIAERSRHRSSPPFVKITAVCDPTFPFNTPITVNNLNIIGNKITRLAERFGITVRFNVLSRRMTELDRSVLGCEPGEALAVNFAFVLSRIADESVSPANPRDQLLRRVKSLEPNVVVIVEQEMNANTAPFAPRFTEACNYYGSILDSLDVMMNRENPDRVRIESGLARKAANSIAREGADRIERPEVLGKWRARMSMAGFKQVEFGPGVSEPVKLRFGSMKANPGFTCKEEGGRLGFGWMGRVMVMVSAWR